MARQIKWRLQFKSLNGTGCLVNIYEDGYTGSGLTSSGKTGANVPFDVESGVTALTGASIPFEYEEDDSNDLTEFIRVKTGYINVIEENYGDLNGLQPTGIQHHFVEAYYGTERVFSGYMQQQEFQDEWTACPRELSFPIINPLGLLESFKFDSQVHEMSTIGFFMHQLLCKLNPSATSMADSDYTSVIYPRPNLYPWNAKIFSSILSPYNPDYKRYAYSQELYAPEDLMFFLEGLCTSMGWIIHDTPDQVVFAQYDYKSTSQCSSITVANLQAPTTRTNVDHPTTSFGSYFTICKDENEQTIVQPFNRIEVEPAGKIVESVEMNIDHATATAPPSYNGDNSRHIPLTAQSDEVSSDVLGTAIFDNHDEIYNYGLFPIGYGNFADNNKKVSMSYFWVLRYSTDWAAGKKLISVKFAKQVPVHNGGGTNGNTILHLAVERGSSLRDMHASGYDSFVVNLVIRIDNRYVDLTNNTLVNYERMNAVTIDGNTGKITPNYQLANNSFTDVDGIIFPLYNSVADK